MKKAFGVLLLILLVGTAYFLMNEKAATHLVDENAIDIREVEEGVYLVDFGKVAFGNVRLSPPFGINEEMTFHFGEALEAGRVNRQPPGTVRYKAVTVDIWGGESIVLAPEKDPRNTQSDSPYAPPAILTPEEWGVVLPFRWLEIEGWKGPLLSTYIVRQTAYSSRWEDDAAEFACSDEKLNKIWELCRYSIKATTFAGVYVDGDRERIPYEADSYLNQLSHYYTDNDIQMARDTIDYLFGYATWPSEWAPHMVFMVYADWMQTGDRAWLAGVYETLKGKTLSERKGEDGLIWSNEQHLKKGDIVDWPKGERDGYVFTSRNTVVNAFHLEAIKMMSDLARALGKEEEAKAFEVDYLKTKKAFEETFWDADKELFRDGVDTEHSALHANLFPLAFDLVPESSSKSVASWLADRGMRCSVYAAQYLMEALFENGEGEAAIGLMTAENDRSWWHMVESGATITWEAWDQKYKPNQDWNHAWGAAPANLLPRYVLGVEALSPGWDLARIRPHVSGLSEARGKVPTPRGAIRIDWRNSEDGFVLSVDLPKGMKGRVELPVGKKGTKVYRDGELVEAELVEGRWVVEIDGSGELRIEK